MTNLIDPISGDTNIYNVAMTSAELIEKLNSLGEEILTAQTVRSAAEKLGFDVTVTGKYADATEIQALAQNQEFVAIWNGQARKI